MRVKKGPVKIKYKKYLGKPYDLAFQFDNGKWYCSELIYDIYKIQLGIELCKPRKIREYRIEGMEDVLKKRGMDLDQRVVAPCDLLNYWLYLWYDIHVQLITIVFVCTNLS